ncbi:copper chaperone PCu(A)C [Sulfurivermis fontis]|uniref:copper chaperone PCu(A)C n=1 Tax=Sulfurivermis fontis TaxID=1972068 RepID=UPI000FDBD761|nr:copper chaperone PCu(A)C [Sulfurivermis fontis]
MSMRTILLFVVTLLLLACAGQEPAMIRVEGAWIPEIPPLIAVTAGWMVLHNDGDMPKYLIGAFSPNAENIDIHQSVVVNDTARMVLQEVLEVPPHGSLVFSNETGYHLMLYKSRGMHADARIPIRKV